MDAIDLKILSALSADARMSNKVLAASVQLSPSTCLERVRRLRETGVIRGFHADLSPSALGINVEALLFIELAKHNERVVNDYFSHVLSLPETRTAFIITGRHDVLVHVAVRDTAHLKDLILSSFTIGADVLRVETVIIFDVQHTFGLGRSDEEAAGAAGARKSPVP
jgi:DNA-binding Lrp family transcriptional regulator